MSAKPKLHLTPRHAHADSQVLSGISMTSFTNEGRSVVATPLTAKMKLVCTRLY